MPFTRGGKWYFSAEKSSFLKLKSTPFLWKVPFYLRKRPLREGKNICLFTLKQALLKIWKAPFCLRKKSLYRRGKNIGLFTLKSAILRLKTALLFEKKGFLREGKKVAFFFAEKSPILKLKSALLFEKKAFYGKEKKMSSFRWKVPFIKVEKCPFSLKRAFSLKKGLLRGGICRKDAYYFRREVWSTLGFRVPFLNVQKWPFVWGKKAFYGEEFVFCIFSRKCALFQGCKIPVSLRK